MQFPLFISEILLLVVHVDILGQGYEGIMQLLVHLHQNNIKRNQHYLRIYSELTTLLL